MPCDYSKYPANWFTEIRPRILARAGEKRDEDGNILEQARCEKCGVRNGATGMRDTSGIFHEPGPVFHLFEYPPGVKLFKVVLTIAHKDHNPQNYEDSNLAAWCQYDHLLYDAREHAKNAKIHRAQMIGQLRLRLEGDQ
jgi:hypothetical protein